MSQAVPSSLVWGARSKFISAGGSSAPVNTVLPVIDNTTPTAGDTLNVTNGTWTGSPTSFTYQWKYSDGTPIAGATASAYTTVFADIGKQIKCTVTATNGAGSASATSLATTAVANFLALQLEADQITGVADGGSIVGIPWPNAGTTGATNNGTSLAGSAGLLWKASNSVFNGKPTVQFNSLADGMATGLALTNPYTIILVAAAVDLSLATVPNRTINSQDNNCLISINRNTFAVFNGGTVFFDTNPNGTAAHIVTLSTGAQSRFRIDGVDVTTGTNFTGDWGRISLGFNSMNPEPANAYIAAVGVLLSTDAAKIALIESTWKAKYGTP